MVCFHVGSFLLLSFIFVKYLRPTHHIDDGSHYQDDPRFKTTMNNNKYYISIKCSKFKLLNHNYFLIADSSKKSRSNNKREKKKQYATTK